MNTYEVKRIDVSNIKNMDDYQKAKEKATPHYCRGLKEVWKFCGGKLSRERCGYSGSDGKYEYIATRC